MADSTIWTNKRLANTPYSVVVEDDQRVGSAYLLVGSKIVADVWLYNRVAPPDVPEWETAREPPYLNPEKFVCDGAFTPIRMEQDIDVQWEVEPEITATVFIRGERWAVLKIGAKPGWCKLAKQTGPLAKPLAELTSPVA